MAEVRAKVVAGSMLALPVLAAVVLLGAISIYDSLEDPSDDQTFAAPIRTAAPTAATSDDEPNSGTTHGTGISLEALRVYTSRCKGPPVRDAVNGVPRLMCQVEEATPCVLEAMGAPHDFARVTLMVGMPREATLKGVDIATTFIQLVAGKKAGEITPDGWLRQLGERKQTFTHAGLTYTTTPIPAVGMLSVVVEREPR